MKTCRKCGLTKPVELFHKNRGRAAFDDLVARYLERR